MIYYDYSRDNKAAQRKRWNDKKRIFTDTGIPVRTLEDWEASRRTPPEYIPRLIAYQLKYEELLREKENDNL